MPSPPRTHLNPERTSKHILNAQVSIRAPCCRAWFDCAQCHAEQRPDHRLRRTTEMTMLCKKCRKAFRKDLSDPEQWEESDEFCPWCDNKYVLEAKIPQAVIGVEGEDLRKDNRMIKDERMRQPARTDLDDAPRPPQMELTPEELAELEELAG
ncbi:hypothetical protein GLOTRDRAFT_61193 [Gloeophyllum trabeum ATCC 11539]|uniref:CHY-type domain-containing protein n=1 Tax=Gloeophyllum trabeum (strain ATCC 11539 / FP-39264 / Madison 617) TaxID=670483 RepID=S7Q5E7_GLOTA|nr:uncharacterized protein GLOTRDRAFT_61193 [Gloeophyllum trabeum ATCC 11539]EPQ55271.1 hypothetical protein GLOTRDRAFT_61193 [Gloeophyllum trabeum ATCC 11539]